MNPHLVGWIPVRECPTRPGKWHLSAVWMSWWPEDAVTLTGPIGLPPDTQISWDHCNAPVEP